MLLQPKKITYKKKKRKYLKHLITTKRSSLCFGFYGIKVLESFRFSAKQIETIRQCINREIKRKGKVWIRIFPDISVTKKPNENRMGRGKGSLSFWCAPVRAGTIIFELSEIFKKRALIALKKGCFKIPVKTTIVVKNA